MPNRQPSIVPIDLGPSNGAAGLLLLIAWPLAVLLILLYLLTVAAEKLLELITTNGENPTKKNHAHNESKTKGLHSRAVHVTDRRSKLRRNPYTEQRKSQNGRYGASVDSSGRH